jgi:hypothetical protein
LARLERFRGKADINPPTIPDETVDNDPFQTPLAW